MMTTREIRARARNSLALRTVSSTIDGDAPPIGVVVVAPFASSFGVGSPPRAVSVPGPGPGPGRSAASLRNDASDSACAAARSPAPLVSGDPRMIAAYVSLATSSSSHTSSGVAPSAFVASASAPCAMSQVTSGQCDRRVASCSAVSPRAFRERTVSPSLAPASRTRRTLATLPRAAAARSAVASTAGVPIVVAFEGDSSGGRNSPVYSCTYDRAADSN